jgi:hypothetical protein
MSYKKLNQININCDSFLSNIKFSNPISIPNSSNNRNITGPNNRNITGPNNRNISYNVKNGNKYLVGNIENESPNICFSSNKAGLCKNIIKDNKSCCC